MTRRVTPEEVVEEAVPAEPVKRLCNEIQLFDLCDREKCGFKEGVYCTEPDLLRKFESIAEEDDRPPASRDRDGGEEDDEEWDDDGEYDDSFEDERFEGDFEDEE